MDAPSIINNNLFGTRTSETSDFEYGLVSDNLSHLLDPKSRREFAFDRLLGGEKVMGEEKPERGSPGLGDSEFSLIHGNMTKDNI